MEDIDIMCLLGEYLIDDADDLNSFYNDSMELIFNFCIEKDSAINKIINSSELSNIQRDIYILKFALIDKNVFNCLEYIWDIVYNIKINPELIGIEISKLKKFG